MQAELAEIEFVRADTLLEKGREEGERLLLLRLLHKKFPSVKDWESHLQQIVDLQVLEQLFDEGLDIDDPRQMLRRVKAAAKGR